MVNTRTKWGYFNITIAFLIIIVIGCGKTTTSDEENRMSLAVPPTMQIDTQKSYKAKVITSVGDFTIQLFPVEAPITVNNFVHLAKKKYFEGIIFHRVVRDFVVQTGDPTGTGTGGPGYQFNDELNSPYKYEQGIVAMANAGPNTNGSQFFVCSGALCNNLNDMPNYTIFGQVVEGMQTIQAINDVEVNANDKPLRDIVIKTVTIEEK
jgi:cyclophilin family peptidyl-prolyl cis-trans isomerase